VPRLSKVGVSWRPPQRSGPAQPLDQTAHPQDCISVRIRFGCAGNRHGNYWL